MSYLLLLVGIVMVLVGADKLTDGATALAKRFHVSDLVIGLTVVAFGTSLPEFVTSFTAVLNHYEAISMGNIIGSNIFNTLLIVGASALTFPIWVSKTSLSKDIPFALLASMALLIVSQDMLFSDAKEQVITMGDGLILLLFFSIFMYYTFSMAHTPQVLPDNVKDENVSTDENSPKANEYGMVRIIVYILIGLAGLIFGGNFFVNSASDLARSWGVSEHIIALTIVAGGTSLPELATSIVAARKGNSAIAIGNVIGSNIFNIFFVVGCCALVSPISAASITSVDLMLLIGSILLLWVFAFTSRRISRLEGALLVLLYVFYMISSITHF